jgi:hypothetical protein
MKRVQLLSFALPDLVRKNNIRNDLYMSNRIRNCERIRWGLLRDKPNDAGVWKWEGPLASLPMASGLSFSGLRLPFSTVPPTIT